MYALSVMVRIVFVLSPAVYILSAISISESIICFMKSLFANGKMDSVSDAPRGDTSQFFRDQNGSISSATVSSKETEADGEVATRNRKRTGQRIAKSQTRGKTVEAQS